MSRLAVEIKNVSYHRYDQHILRDLSLSIAEGEFVVLIGPNGSGKSTLVKLINGLVRPNSGEVRIGGENIVGRAVYEIAERVSTLTQDLEHSTFSDLTVWMNMELALSRKRELTLSSSRSEMREYLNTFNPHIGTKLDLIAGHLSGGQRQALALAMCFAHRPLILILDEHTSALDPRAAESLMELTNAHILKEGLTSIMITHSVEHALRYDSRLIAMNEGRIVLDLSKDKKAHMTKSELIALAY